MCYAGSEKVVVPWDAEDGKVAQEAPESGEAIDETLRYIASAMFRTLHSLVENVPL